MLMCTESASKTILHFMLTFLNLMAVNTAATVTTPACRWETPQFSLLLRSLIYSGKHHADMYAHAHHIYTHVFRIVCTHMLFYMCLYTHLYIPLYFRIGCMCMSTKHLYPHLYIHICTHVHVSIQISICLSIHTPYAHVYTHASRP